MSFRHVQHVCIIHKYTADVDSWTAGVVDVSLSSIDPGVVIEADPQLASAIVDFRTKQLETAARRCPVGASTVNDDDDDDDDEDINNNAVIDPALPTAPHPLIDGTLEAIDRPSVA